MKKIVLRAPGDLHLADSQDEIVLESGTVKVKVHSCAICGSDLALLSGKRDMTKEKYFGHEFVGVVTEVADDSCGFKVGDRVASELSRTCGQCWHCLNGLENYCRSMNEALLPGGFTEETLVRSQADYSFLSKIPDEIEDSVAALLEPTNCAYRIAMRANMKPGETVVVFGIGAMGLITGIILKHLGAKCVIAVGRRPARMEQVRQTGIFDAVIANDEEGQKKIEELCGSHGADIAIEATGAPGVLVDAIQVVRYGGRVVVGSVYGSNIQDFAPLPIFRKELTLVGAKGPYPYRNSDGSSAVVDMMLRVQDELKKIIKVYDYEDALQAFEDAKSGEAIKAVIRYE